MATNTEKIVVQVVVQGQKQLQNLEKQTKGTTLGFNKLTVGIVAAVASFRQINRIVSTAIKSFRDFEFQMAKVKAITGASTNDFLKLSKTAEDLGRSTFFTAQQVAELQTNFGKLGFSTKEILKAQKATLLLATATDTDLARAAIVAGAAVRGFALDASETGRVADVMAVAFTSSALDIEKFQTSMTKVAPIAAGANITLEATTAVMGTLTDAGIEASIAGTSLRNIFLKMQDPASDLSKKLGFTVNSSEDLQKALTMLNEEGLSNAEMMQLVDLRQVAAFQTMINGSENIANLTTKLEQASGAAAVMAETVGDTLEGAFKRFNSAMQGLMINIMDSFVGKTLQNFIDGFAEAINVISDFVDIPISEKLMQEQIEMNALFDVMKDVNASQKTRNKAMHKLNVEYESFLPKLITEKDTVEELSQHQFNSNKQMAQKIRMMGAQERLVKIQEKQQKIAAEEFDVQISLAKALKQVKDGKEEIMMSSEGNVNMTSLQITKDKLRITQLQKEGIIYQKELEDAMKVAEKFGIVLEDNKKIVTPDNNGDDDNDGNGIINESKARNQALLELQLEYAESLTLAEGKSIEEREAYLKGLEDFYNDDKLQIQADFLQAQIDNILTTDEQKIALKQQMAELELTEEQRIQSIKLNNIEDEKEANFALQDAKAAALKGYLKIAAGFVDEGSALAKAIFLLQQAMAVKDVIVTNLRTNAQITAEGLALAIPSFGASTATAATLIAANNAMSALSIAGILAQTVAGISKKAKGGMIEEFANGGMVHGNSHAQGGEKFAVGGRVVELEGGEAVINKRSTAMFRNQLSAMNSAGGGVKFADGGLMNMPSFAQSQFNAAGQAGMMGAMGQGSRVVVVESDITTSQNTVSVIEAEATI
jgi:TP901 family phage tail tape measure protein